MRSSKILLIEDDPNLAFMISDSLESEGFEVIHFSSAEEVLPVFPTVNADIILLDINLKGAMDGFELSKQIRKKSNVPILFTTARTQTCDLEEGYKTGNMDYLKKPFGVRELVLRVNALLDKNIALNVNVDKTDIYPMGKYRFHYKEHYLFFENEKTYLQPNETKLLKMLYDKKGKVLSKSEISMFVWDEPVELIKNASIHNLIASLRSKLKSDTKVSIETISKEGYKLNID